MPKDSWHRMEPLLLEELQVFQVRVRVPYPTSQTSPQHPHMLSMLWVVSSCQDVGARRLHTQVCTLTPAHALPTGCLPHHQPAALLQEGKGGTPGHSRVHHGCA